MNTLFRRIQNITNFMKRAFPNGIIIYLKMNIRNYLLYNLISVFS